MDRVKQSQKLAIRLFRPGCKGAGKSSREAKRGCNLQALCVLKVQNSMPAPSPILPLTCNTFDLLCFMML